jgi:hypothetical protein
MKCWWEIRNKYGDKVCSRGTLRACRELIAKYATEPPTFSGWSNGPYSIWRCSAEWRCTPRLQPRHSPGADDAIMLAS